MFVMCLMDSIKSVYVTIIDQDYMSIFLLGMMLPQLSTWVTTLIIGLLLSISTGSPTISIRVTTHISYGPPSQQGLRPTEATAHHITDNRGYDPLQFQPIIITGVTTHILWHWSNTTTGVTTHFSYGNTISTRVTTPIIGLCPTSQQGLRPTSLATVHNANRGYDPIKLRQHHLNRVNYPQSSGLNMTLCRLRSGLHSKSLQNVANILGSV